jgi:hypothetical protein
MDVGERGVALGRPFGICPNAFASKTGLEIVHEMFYR